MSLVDTKAFFAPVLPIEALNVPLQYSDGHVYLLMNPKQ